ncbi:MAG: conjugal transfer protein TraU [Desulfobacterales bacterium]|nr:conjugal transfer protein TraU [Desulfobacterales bacterium]
MIETVKDPYCFPTLGGATIGSAPNGTLSGGSDEKEDGNSATFSQSHYYIFPVWSLMEIMTDSVCFQGSSKLDIGYITELDPFWQSDSMAMLFQPEVLLFANPIAQLSCIADSISSNLGFPLSALFWCAGSHGSVYPLTGAVNDKNLVQAQMTIAERMIYKLSRQALIWDPAIWACAAMPTPIWVKQNYRFQLSKPIRTLFSHPPGRSDLLWGSLKNPPTGGDNFTWIVFRKRLCCAF